MDKWTQKRMQASVFVSMGIAKRYLQGKNLHKINKFCGYNPQNLLILCFVSNIKRIISHNHKRCPRSLFVSPADLPASPHPDTY